MSGIKLRIRVQDMDEDAAKLAVVELNRLCCWQQEEIERLQAIVDKLPKTADGVPLVLGMGVWLPGYTRWPGEVERDFSVNPCVDWPEKIYNPEALYSTREAAEKVR